MITDIPEPADFSQSSVNLLHLAWSIASTTLSDLDCADLPSWDNDGSIASTYVEKAQAELGNALALLMQAQEMGLKARIAAVSPFLLISRDPRDWPRGCNTTDIAFADFRSVDAADLIRIHDTVKQDRLPQKFVQLFNHTRRRRNVVVHTVSKHDRIHPKEIFQHVLRAVRHLHPDIHWPTERIRYLGDSPLSLTWSNDFSYGTVLTEMRLCTETLDRGQAVELLGFDKNAPVFFCPNCNKIKGECYEFPALAQLDGDQSTSIHLRCFVCNQVANIIRRTCLNPSCMQRVLFRDCPEEGEFLCLECNEATDPDEAEVSNRIGTPP